MRQQPVVLVSRDPALIAEVRQAALQAACSMEVAPELSSDLRGSTGMRQLLLGGDLASELPLRDPDSLVVMLRHHGEPETDHALMLPDARSWLVDRLRAISATPAHPLAPALAVMGASGGVGASTLAIGLVTALASAARDEGATLLDFDAVPGQGSSGQDPGWRDGRAHHHPCAYSQPADAEDALRSACARSSVVVVDAPRWTLPCTPWFDAVVVVLANRVHSLAAASRLVPAIREAGLHPSFVLATGVGGLWPADVERALAVSLTATWPTDRSVARAADRGDLVRTLTKGKWRRACLAVADAALKSQVPSRLSAS